MNIIEAKNISHSYFIGNKRVNSLDNISFDIDKGEFVALLGKNGCGKSTLAKHINALIPLQNGNLTVAQYNAKDPNAVWKIRKSCGMVFQNPDNQFVSSIVEEDIKFGLKNFGLDYSDEIVKSALELVDMPGYERRNINSLSGGQKQRIALAGVLAIKPDIIILDEATTMLPPNGRADVLNIIKKLHAQTDTTFLMITQYIDEAVIAGRVLIMSDGKIVADGTPKNILSDIELLQNTGLKPPLPVSIYNDLYSRGIKLSECPLNNEELVEQLCQLK